MCEGSSGDEGGAVCEGRSGDEGGAVWFAAPEAQPVQITVRGHGGRHSESESGESSESSEFAEETDLMNVDLKDNRLAESTRVMSVSFPLPSSPPLPLCLSLSVCLCLSVCLSVCLSLLQRCLDVTWLCACVRACARTPVCVRACVCACVCVRTCVLVYVLTRVCVCVGGGGGGVSHACRQSYNTAVQSVGGRKKRKLATLSDDLLQLVKTQTAAL